MTKEVKRNYLEINSLHDLKESEKPSEDYKINLIENLLDQLNLKNNLLRVSFLREDLEVSLFLDNFF